MTISSTVRIAGPFIGTSTATVFPFAFKIFTASNLQVVRVDTSTGLESTLVLTTDYTVSLNADQDSNPGGNVTLLAVLATGFNMVITSDIANLQPTDLTNQGGFYPEVITDALDRATIQIQQMADELTRSIKIPISDGLSLDMELPSAAARANSFLAFDATGEPTVVTAGSPGSPASITRQQFSGTGAQVAYTLASDPGALGNSCEVFVGGIYQQRDTYTIAGTTLTFTAAPVAGTDNIEVVNFLTTAIGTTDSSLVTYVPAGAGATQRTVQAKLRDVVSVKDFGAVGDGVANDTAAIQAALSSGATSVHITAGTYLVTGLTIAASCTIYGSGILKKGTASATPLLNITASNVTVDGVEFRGASYNATPTTRVVGDTAINCEATSSVSPYANLAIRNVIINGFADFGVNVRFGQDIDVSNIAVAYCGYAGILFLSVLRGNIEHNNIREINSSAGAVNWYGISLTRDPSQTSVASIPCTQCIIANNIVTNITQWTGIDTHAAYRCIITGNNVSGCTRGIYAQYDSTSATYQMAAQQVEISNNTVVGPQTASASVIGIASLGLAALPNDGIFIIGNTIVGCGDYGGPTGAIHIDSSTNSKASDNHVMRAIRMGISLTGTSSYVDISRNIVDGVQTGSSSASYAYLQLANLTNCSFNDNRMRNTTGSGTFTPAQGIIYAGTTPSTGVVLSRNRMDSITIKLQKISGSSNIYTDLAWQLETESCAAFTHSCTGGAVIEATASQVSNFRRTPNTTGTSIVRPRVVFEPATAAAYKLGVRGNYGGGTIYGAGVYSLDGTTNITAATSVPNIVISIDGIYWND